MSEVNWRNVIARALWTFVQGAIGTVTVLPYITDETGWVNVANGAIAGGVAALVSFIKTLAVELNVPTPKPEDQV